MAEAIFSNIQLGEESLMSIQSSYPDHKCGKCGINIKKGDAINKIDATGQWCSNENCPNPAKEVIPRDVEIESTKVSETVEPESKYNGIKNFARDEIQILKHIEQEVKEDLGKVVDTKIGMYVKLIYVKHYMQPIGDI